MTSGTWLAHHGIKGQKWGVRRFQNEDGTLTPAGRERYDVGEASNSERIGSAFRKGSHAGGMKPPRDLVAKSAIKNVGKYILDKPKELIDVASKGLDAAKKVKAFVDKKTSEPYERVESLPRLTEEDLASMSNDQLRSYIDRLSLEDRFNAAMEDHDKKAKGKDTLDKILDDAGDILVVAGSAAGLALTIKQLVAKG